MKMMEALGRIAATMDRSHNWVINDALKSYVEDHVWLEEQVALRRQEIADGKGIPHKQAAAQLRQHIASITHADVIRTMLRHGKRATDPPPIAPARAYHATFAWASPSPDSASSRVPWGQGVTEVRLLRVTLAAWGEHERVRDVSRSRRRRFSGQTGWLLSPRRSLAGVSRVRVTGGRHEKCALQSLYVTSGLRNQDGTPPAALKGNSPRRDETADG
jgi:predicted transcriptional regulator